MNLEDDIAYWTKCVDQAPTKDAALLAFCVATGLKLARSDHAKPLQDALRKCQTLTPSLLSGEQAIERLKEINVHVYNVLDPHRHS